MKVKVEESGQSITTI